MYLKSLLFCILSFFTFYQSAFGMLGAQTFYFYVDAFAYPKDYQGEAEKQEIYPGLIYGGQFDVDGVDIDKKYKGFEPIVVRKLFSMDLDKKDGDAKKNTIHAHGDWVPVDLDGVGLNRYLRTSRKLSLKGLRENFIQFFPVTLVTLLNPLPAIGTLAGLIPALPILPGLASASIASAFLRVIAAKIPLLASKFNLNGSTRISLIKEAMAGAAYPIGVLVTLFRDIRSYAGTLILAGENNYFRKGTKVLVLNKETNEIERLPVKDFMERISTPQAKTALGLDEYVLPRMYDKKEINWYISDDQNSFRRGWDVKDKWGGRILFWLGTFGIKIPIELLPDREVDDWDAPIE